MSALTSHLVRRGMEAHTYISDKKVKIDIPAWGMVMLGSTALLYFFAMFMVDYTFGRVIPALLMIESPQDNINFEPLPTDDNDDSMIKDPEPTTGKPQFITSSFRGTIRLLQSKGGFRARFRGFWVFIANSMAVQWFAGILQVLPLIRNLPFGFTAVVAAVLCAQLSLAWTHIVISEPSPKAWFRRIPTITMWKKIAGPTALYAIAEQVSLMLPFYLAISLGLDRDPKEIPNLTDSQQKAIISKSICIFALGLVLAFLLVIPANVTLTRMQASLLSDAEETIVPFDRSFGGKVIPEIVGGQGMVGVLDAWKTFDWAARVRLIKTYAKVVAMQIGVSILFTVVLVCQILAIGGKNMHKIIVPADGKN